MRRITKRGAKLTSAKNINSSQHSYFYHIAISLIILCAQHALFSMDQANATTQEAIIKQIYVEIYTKYGSNPAHNDLFYGLTDMITQSTLNPTECLDIISIVKQHCARNTEIDLPDTFQKLYSQNDFFKSAIDHFVARASYNLKLLTAHNITTIENPQKQQPTPALNQLPLPIKTYVMNRALQQINYSYDIILTGQHQDDIQAFDICELTDQAVTSSFKEKPTPIKDFINFAWPDNKTHNWNTLFLLWDLKTGKTIRSFEEPNPIDILTFNPDGSCIAAALYNENTVKIWCPKTGNLLHQFLSYCRIDCLNYSHPKPSILIATYRVDSHCPIITQWSLTTDYKAGELLNTSYVYGRRKYQPFFGNKYLAEAPLMYLTGKKNELHITKKNCIPLFLCLQAIGKANVLTQNKQIESSASYHQLTSLEMTRVNNAIQQKLAASQKDKKLELRTLDK